jgi:hypothetical protein
MRRALASIGVLLLVAGCTADPYALPTGTDHNDQRNPVSVGHPSEAVVIYLQVRPGDRLELLSAEPASSIDGATVTFFLSRPVHHDTGENVIGEKLEELRGAVVTAVAPSASPENTVGIVAQMTPSRAGRYELDSVRLRYRVNGGSERVTEGIDVAWTVCADDPAPTDCPEPES